MAHPHTVRTMISDRLTYLVHRLGTLSTNELFWRIVSWARHGAGRLLCLTPWAGLPERSHADLNRITVSRVSKSIPVAFDEAQVGAIPERWWDDDSFWETLSQRYPEEAKLIVDRAQLVLLDTFRLFQWKEVRQDMPVTWSDTMEPDALSALWPTDYYSTIGISYDPLHPSRDIKWCWELNRFQHLLLLSAAWRSTEEERFAAMASEAAPDEESRSCCEMHAHSMGGYEISKDEMFNLIFDCCPLGLPPGYGHGHCDALSFILHFQGRPLFIDPGTFLYNGPAEWRNYFHSTAAHNTIRINGKEPSKRIGAFRWIKGFRASGGPHVYGKDYRLLKGSLEWGTILHTRYILHLELRAILIIDHILGSENHSLESSLHLDPAWQVRRSRKDTWTVHNERDRLEIVRFSKESSEPDLLYGSDNPRGGWYSRCYGHKIPTVTLRWSEQKDLPTVSVIGIKPSGTTVCAGFENLCPDLPDEAASLIKSRALHHSFESGIQEDSL